MTAVERGDRSARVLPQPWVIPVVDELNAPFFTSAELRLQRCTGCGTVQHPPAELCHGCGGLQFDHVVAPARGTVVARTLVHHAANPALADAVPYLVVLVQPDGHGGVRIAGNVVGDVASDDVQIGSTVTATWASVGRTDDGQEILLPQWRPLSSTPKGATT